MIGTNLKISDPVNILLLQNLKETVFCKFRAKFAKIIYSAKLSYFIQIVCGDGHGWFRNHDCIIAVNKRWITEVWLETPLNIQRRL